MKTLCLSLILFIAAVPTFAAGESTFSTDRVGNITIHTYQSDDPLGDVSFIIESENKIVLLEPQAFEKNTSELLDYSTKLDKPLDKILVAFHPAGLKAYPEGEKLITEAMDEFVKSDAGKGMLAHFKEVFQGEMDVEVVSFDNVVTKNSVLDIDGVTYTISPSSLPGMPGANVDIDGKILYQHFVPVAGTHPSPYHINSKQAISAALVDAEKAKNGGYALLIGSHLPGKGNNFDLEFQIEYLKVMKTMADKATSAVEFTTLMKNAYPDLQGEKNLEAVAGKLFI